MTVNVLFLHYKSSINPFVYNIEFRFSCFGQMHDHMNHISATYSGFIFIYFYAAGCQISTFNKLV